MTRIDEAEEKVVEKGGLCVAGVSATPDLRNSDCPNEDGVYRIVLKPAPFSQPRHKISENQRCACLPDNSDKQMDFTNVIVPDSGPGQPHVRVVFQPADP